MAFELGLACGPITKASLFCETRLLPSSSSGGIRVALESPIHLNWPTGGVGNNDNDGTPEL